MRNLFLIFGKVLILASLVSCGFSQNKQTNQNAWNPSKTWVFFVGLLDWQDSKQFSSFPQKNRRDKVLLDVLREKGVPESQILYLQDKESTTDKIQKSFETFLSKAKSGDTVFVYYCGHGYKPDNKETFLASYDAGVNGKGWSVNSIPNTIEKFFKGSNALIMLDNCYSGAMAEAVKNRQTKISYAVLASSHFNSFSTGNWTFTESLIYAFRGEPFIDENSDGKVSISELMENSADDMLFAEEQLAQFQLTGNFSQNLVIAETKGKNQPRLGERVEAFDQGSWYEAIITDVQNGKYKVHYFGYVYNEDAYKTEKQIRPKNIKTYSMGTKVEAEWQGKWYPAKVLQTKGGAYLISYDGFGKEWDEWIPSSRVRK